MLHVVPVATVMAVVIAIPWLRHHWRRNRQRQDRQNQAGP
jgi:hypothetical protein